MFSKHQSASRMGTETQWKIESDVHSLHTDLLSARCIVDRLRIHLGYPLVSQHADPQELTEIRSNLTVITGFLDDLEKLLGLPEPVRRKNGTRQ